MMSRIQAFAAASLFAGLFVVSACARERGEQAQVPPRRLTFRPHPIPGPGQSGTVTAPQPTNTAPIASATASTTALPTSTASAPPTGTAGPSMSPTDLIKFQDACWKNCDQFACMKIAEAYRTGAGLPQDVLAGRRYAVHACQECGTPSVAVDSYCPNWGLEKK
ncbi:MAG: hypothetical protein JNL21_07400 [Myxococcales bacterium]|nr:hypothetical protein [Myxococcales bacterium]